MFGSIGQPELMGDHGTTRLVLLRMPMLLPADDAAKQIAACLSAYEGDRHALLLGYWDYGAEIVITAPGINKD